MNVRHVFFPVKKYIDFSIVSTLPCLFLLEGKGGSCVISRRVEIGETSDNSTTVQDTHVLCPYAPCMVYLPPFTINLCQM